MTSLVRRIPFILIALLASALAGAPSAAANEWVDGGEELPGEVAATFTGVVGPVTALGTFECVVHGAVDLKPGGTGNLKSLEFTAKTCAGTGVLAGCKLEKYTLAGMPWLMHATAIKIDVTKVDVKFEYDAKCAVEESRSFYPSLDLIPNNTAAISSTAIAGEGIVEIAGLELEAEATGELELSPTGTYGIQ